MSARFMLAGAPEPDNAASIPFEQLRSWHGESGVEWRQGLNDEALAWSDVHVACLPSRREAVLPEVLLEAAARGLPVVTTDSPGCRDVVQNGDNGFLVPPGNVPALAKALCLLIADGDLRRRMGRQGRARVEREFSSARVIADTLAVYRPLLPARSESGRTAERCRNRPWPAGWVRQRRLLWLWQSADPP